MNKLYLIILLFTGIYLAGCETYTPIVRTNFTPVDSFGCPGRPHHVYLFFDDENPQQLFELPVSEIGQIEAVAHDTVETEKLYHYLKYRAWQNCANGVKNISLTKEVREEQTVKVATGTAIQIIEPGYRYADYTTPADTSFIEIVKEDSGLRKEKQNTEDKKTMIIVGAGLAILFAAFALL